MEPRFTNANIIRTPRYYEQFFLPRTLTSPPGPSSMPVDHVFTEEVPLQFNIELNEFNSCLSLFSPINS